MNQYVKYESMPILNNAPHKLKLAIDNIVDTGYVLEVVSRVGVASTHIGYKYLVAGIEILLTEENFTTPKMLFTYLSEIFDVKPNVIKRAMSVCCGSCRYDMFRKTVLDATDRNCITEKAFCKLDLISMLGYFVSHCVDRAEQKMPEYANKRQEPLCVS